MDFAENNAIIGTAHVRPSTAAIQGKNKRHEISAPRKGIKVHLPQDFTGLFVRSFYDDMPGFTKYAPGIFRDVIDH
jgi:hypothetical protein